MGGIRMKLRSIELELPDAAGAAAFLTDIWGLAAAEVIGDTHYLRGSGGFPYLVALRQAMDRCVRSTTFVCSPERLDALAETIAHSNLPARAVVSEDPGGGAGLIVELAEGELLRFLAGTREAAPIPGQRDMPVQLAHVVFNSVDAEASATLAEQALGFRVSDRTKGMVFVRCNEAHHSTAFARAGRRGIGRMRDHGFAPAWGPGRHGPGDNAFAYFIAPFGAVIEFSTAVGKVPEDYRAGAPDDWAWPPNRIDQWGVSDKDFAGLRAAEEKFRFRRDWVASRAQTPHSGA